MEPRVPLGPRGACISAAAMRLSLCSQYFVILGALQLRQLCARVSLRRYSSIHSSISAPQTSPSVFESLRMLSTTYPRQTCGLYFPRAMETTSSRQFFHGFDSSELSCASLDTSRAPLFRSWVALAMTLGTETRVALVLSGPRYTHTYTHVTYISLLCCMCVISLISRPSRVRTPTRRGFMETKEG